jgi:hypothetical protein
MAASHFRGPLSISTNGRITVGNEHDYIDLVFHHRLLRCHLIIDLKVLHFRHSDAGQMNFYLNYWKREITTPEDNPPVGVHATPTHAINSVNQTVLPFIWVRLKVLVKRSSPHLKAAALSTLSHNIAESG